MGRVKLKIKRLESTSNRQVTYSKRRNGILKKAKELSILCDIDLILLMFSPTGKPTLFRGERSNIEEVIAKFAQLTPQERTKSCWSNPDKIDNIEHLRQMEDSLRESLNRIQIQKENFAKHPLMSLECTSQFQNGMHLPLMMGGMQEAPLSWLPDNENQHMLLTGDPNFLPQRDVECSTDHSLPTYSGYFGPGKAEIENTRHVDNPRQEGGALHGLDSTACLRLQLNEQYSYHPYSGLDLQEAKKLRPETEMNLHGNPLDYQINSNFQLSRPIYDNMHHAWVPPPEPCSISMFNGNSYSQVSIPCIVVHTADEYMSRARKATTLTFTHIAVHHVAENGSCKTQIATSKQFCFDWIVTDA
ncbi:hypothetical protein TEA_007361 [Camellia sinensis var. sinensis]|uniref:MADS-box domain-containing protein n=1 Tax=Camellia sinensis var. sinensis TaxID=542762 RepID=A0A4S4D697_CAMSN|nr:hypothetical protein TEA_007361 [Camellia sinensis var. sinensis]